MNIQRGVRGSPQMKKLLPSLRMKACSGRSRQTLQLDRGYLDLTASVAMILVSQVANNQIPAAQTCEVQVGRKQFCIKQFC